MGGEINAPCWVLPSANTGGIPFELVLPEETVAAMRDAESGATEELSLDDLKSQFPPK